MSDQPLDTLLAKLTAGDESAAEEVFRAYEPYLRAVVRRHLSAELRVRFDSRDIVQSVWLRVLKRFRDVGCRFADRQHLRAFLVRLTRHRFIDRLRRCRPDLEHRVSPPGGNLEDLVGAVTPEPSAIIQADELWKQLLELCPLEHREILLLKRDGTRTAEIAERIGLNPGSVRRILSGLARRLACRQLNRPVNGSPHA